MTPVLRAVRGGFRRRVPVLVTGLVLLVSSAASVLGLALAVDSNAPFDQAFAAQRGADAVVTTAATAAELAATRRLPEVTAAAGPFAEATVTARLAGRPGPTLPPLTLAGRATPGGPVDDLVIQSGHWARGPGQVVLSSSDDSLPPLPLGTQLTVTGLPGTLTVVGLAASVTGSADGWVTPATAAALHPAALHPAALHPAAAQMLYRFRNAGTAAAVRAGVAAVAAALPPHAIGSALSWLTVRAEQEPGHRADRAVPDRVRRHRPGAVRADRDQRGQRGGAGRVPADRHPEEHRLHPGAGRGGLHQPGHDPGRGRLPGRAGDREPAGRAAARPDRHRVRGGHARRARLGERGRARRRSSR